MCSIEMDELGSQNVFAVVVVFFLVGLWMIPPPSCRVSSYPVRFVTYLARLLLNYDKASRELWDEMATNIPMSFRYLECDDRCVPFPSAICVGA